MSSSVKITVLLPAFNAMPYLQYALESVLDQDLNDFLVIVINDGSTDGTAQYLDSIRDPRLKVVHQENKGFIHSLNYGATLIETPYMARMDADDIMVQGRLKAQQRFLDAHPDVVAVGSRMNYIAGNNKRFSIGFGKLKKTPSYMPDLENPPFWNPPVDRGTLPHPSVTLRMNALQNVGGYREIVPSQDVDLWLRLHDSGHRLACLENVHLLYRLTADSTSQQNIIKQKIHVAYAWHCHECRNANLESPNLQSFKKGFELDSHSIEEELFRGKLRQATGVYLSGKRCSAIFSTLSLITRRPRSFWRLVSRKF